MSDRIIATTIPLKTIIKLTPSVREFLSMIMNFDEFDETAEMLGIAEDGRIFVIKDLNDTDVTVPVVFTHQILMYEYMKDLEIIV